MFNKLIKNMCFAADKINTAYINIISLEVAFAQHCKRIINFRQSIGIIISV